jgi:hypothetical protein
MSRLDEATIVHEALHNLTGLDDDGLLLFVGLPALLPKETMIDPITRKNRITQQLNLVGCAP